MKIRSRATRLKPGDVILSTGKTVSFSLTLDVSQTPGLAKRLNCVEMSAVGFVGEPLPVLFTDQIGFLVDRLNPTLEELNENYNL